MKLIERVVLDQEDNDYLQYLQFEIDAYENILSRILINKNPKYEYSKENYTHFMNEYKEAIMKQKLCVSEILEKYGFQEYLGDKKYYYEFDFLYCILEIQELEPQDMEHKNQCKGCGSSGK